MSLSTIQKQLGKNAESLLGFDSPKISKERLHLPSKKFLDETFSDSSSICSNASSKDAQSSEEALDLGHAFKTHLQ